MTTPKLELTVVVAVRADTTAVAPTIVNSAAKPNNSIRTFLKMGRLTSIFLFFVCSSELNILYHKRKRSESKGLV
jgi:hypothetical protein